VGIVEELVKIWPNEVCDTTSEVSAPELMVEFHCKHPGALRHIQCAEFDNIFHSESIAPRHSNLEGEVNVRG